MDLTALLRPPRSALLCVLLIATGCSSDAPLEYGDDAILLPATLGEAYGLAEAIALEWSESAWVTKLGGGFTIMDADGRSQNHSFRFHSRFGPSSKRLDIHLIGGAAWTQEQIDHPPAPTFRGFDEIADSDEAVAAAINIAALLNETSPGSLPIPERFAARLESRVQWPEAGSGLPGSPKVAWRVDFIIENEIAVGQAVPFSTARFYFDPVSLELFGDPIISTELYPRP